MARINAVNRALRSVQGEAQIDLDNLFSVPIVDPDAANPNTQASSDVMLISWNAVVRNESQPRQNFDKNALQELANSIRQDGQLQPILVRPHPQDADKYQIVAGERRWRACGPEYANLPFVRAVVRRNVSDDEAFRLALIENVMREDLNDVDKARGLVALKTSLEKLNTRVKWSDVAATLGYSPVHISRLVSMLRLPADVQDEVRRGTVSSRQARAIAREHDPERRTALVDRAKSGVSSDDLQKEISPSLRHSSATSDAVKPTPGEQLLNIRHAIEFANQVHNVDEWPEGEQAALAAAVQEAVEAFAQLHARLPKALKVL